MRIYYRVTQFWKALHAKPSATQLVEVEQVLGPDLMNLFRMMQLSEQAHSYQVYHKLTTKGQNDPDLLAAALLHDVGKSRYPLNIWERVIVVLGRSLFSRKVEGWGQSAPSGLRRAFVVAAQHPTWGAEMAAQAGASELTINLIKRHQDRAFLANSSDNLNTYEDRLLGQLQLLDEES